MNWVRESLSNQVTAGIAENNRVNENWGTIAQW